MISYIGLKYHTRMSCRIQNTYLNPTITYGKLGQFHVTLSQYLLWPPCAANIVLHLRGMDRIQFCIRTYGILHYMLQCLTELVPWLRWELALADASINYVPRMFYVVQIRRRWGHCNTLIMFWAMKIHGYPWCMEPRIVLLKHLPMSNNNIEHVWPQNIVDTH